MFKMFYPTIWVESVYRNVDFEKLYGKGYRGIISDIDNTLVEHDADASQEAVSFCKGLMDMGFEICFMSNNDKERVTRFNKDIKGYMIYDAKKPLVKNYNKAMEMMGTNKDNTIFIGDQIFTDIWGANNANIKNILVEPISPREEIQIVIKRFFEKIVIYFYKRYLSKKKG